jgi:hypothetical protein
MPAIKSFPIDISAKEPRMTAIALGGMMTAKPPAAIIDPNVNSLSYPRERISGTRVLPNIAVFAMPEPLKAANIVPVIIVSMANLPGIRPTTLSKVSSAGLNSPEWYMTCPIRINSGTALRLNVATDSLMLSINWCNPAQPPRTKIAPMIFRVRKQKATGSLVAISNTWAPKMSRRTNCQLMLLSPPDTQFSPFVS